ncbi:MAG: helix-turn-helix domain-containing protein [Propionibacteriales bacterium]|nr:helix-turn-helix domain-containing protein [Propionibacteriales bacterium]
MNPHRVAIVAVEDVMAFDLGTPSQVFGAAAGPDGEPLYTSVVCTAGGRPVRTSAGFEATVAHGLEAVAAADTVVVPGPAGTSAAAHGRVDEAVLAAVRDATARGARVVSICTGAFVLAAAGLLDGRPATTHWRYADRFRDLFPTVRLDPDVLFVDDGDILTSAGVAAGIDLCLHIVRQDHGATVANAAARRCVVPPIRSGGQAQFIERPLPEDDTTSLAPVRAWAVEHLADLPIGLTELATEARVSVRTLTRRWRAETGQTPLQWLLAQRVRLAQNLLEGTDLPVDEVARRAGFGSAVSLRSHLQAAIGQSPTLYRRAFRRAS